MGRTSIYAKEITSPPDEKRLVGYRRCEKDRYDVNDKRGRGRRRMSSVEV
jgi:hypothetical protein